MPVSITAVVPGQTQEGYEAAMLALRPFDSTGGWIHRPNGAGMSTERWPVFAIWKTRQQGTEFFAKHIHPNLPPGIASKRTYLELHSLVVRPQSESAESRTPDVRGPERGELTRAQESSNRGHGLWPHTARA